MCHSMAPAVLLRDAVALAGSFPALAGANLAVDPGEVVVLVGPNGAGKTSLLRVCAGLLAVTEGEAVVLGCDLRRVRALWNHNRTRKFASIAPRLMDRYFGIDPTTRRTRNAGDRSSGRLRGCDYG